jgi:hypothetical protein
MARMALAAPGVVALRALSRPVHLGLDDAQLRVGAARVAWSVRSLFNHPETMALVRSIGPETLAYWRQVLRYCLQGNLQSVLDEHCHVLRESIGGPDLDGHEAVNAMASALAEALEQRTAIVGADEIGFRHGFPMRKERRIRSRFARRFGHDVGESDSERTTAQQTRIAFNSPFWPFVLASTSVGQEGLDFHTWCHAVVHWNLPSNPVDLEQREGRVHRYKNHAVRKNVARDIGLGPVRDERDPWAGMFAKAAERRPAGLTELVPYWVYPPAGAADGTGSGDVAQIERHVLALPMSREEERIGRLRQSLAIYRMVFGQPRQEDLLTHLLRSLTRDEALALVERMQIDLSPPGDPQDGGPSSPPDGGGTRDP